MRILYRSGTILMISFVLAGCAVQKEKSESFSRVCFASTCFDVEVADEPDERTQGLMFRESLPAGSGMLFVFDQTGTYTFRMKNTLIPLDILWLESSGVVLYIEARVPPCKTDPCPSYGPTAAAMYVLELGSGEVHKHGIRAGERTEIASH